MPLTSGDKEMSIYRGPFPPFNTMTLNQQHHLFGQHRLKARVLVRGMISCRASSIRHCSQRSSAASVVLIAFVVSSRHGRHGTRSCLVASGVDIMFTIHAGRKLRRGTQRSYVREPIPCLSGDKCLSPVLAFMGLRADIILRTG